MMTPPLRRFFRLPWRSRSQIDADVETELAFHLEQRAQELATQEGLSLAAARAEARRRFGDLEYTRTYLRELDGAHERARRRSEWLGDAGQDLRFAARTLRATPAFTLAAVATLALAIGATTVIVGVVDGVLLRPLPFPEPERIMRVFSTQQGERTARHGGTRLREVSGHAAMVPQALPFSGSDSAASPRRRRTLLPVVRASLVVPRR